MSFTNDNSFSGTVFMPDGSPAPYLLTPAENQQASILMKEYEKEAYLEAMNSAEGEKVIIQKVARNKRLLG